MWMYGNLQSVASYGQTQAVLNIDDVSELIPIVVVEDSVQRYDVIVGRTFTDCNNVTFVRLMTNEQLLFAYDMQFPFHDTEVPCEALKRHSMTVLSEKETLPTMAMKLAEVQASDTVVNVMLIYDGEEVNLKKGDNVGVIWDCPSTNQLSSKSKIVAEIIHYDPTLSEWEVQELVKLLNEFRTCFAFNLTELGCIDVIQMDIEDDGKPVVSKPYRTSASERNTISRIVQEWKDAGIVTETTSPYASPVLLVKKKDGEARLVVDYRKLNAQTTRKVFPTPNLDERLETLHGAKLFTTLDLASGYLQVPLTESAKQKSAFITPCESG